jgi:hypothetical protein
MHGATVKKYKVMILLPFFKDSDEIIPLEFLYIYKQDSTGVFTPPVRNPPSSISVLQILP